MERTWNWCLKTVVKVWQYIANHAFGCFWQIESNKIKQGTSKSTTSVPWILSPCFGAGTVSIFWWSFGLQFFTPRLLPVLGQETNWFGFNMECEKIVWTSTCRTSGVSCTRSNPCPSIKRDLGFRLWLPVEFKQQPIGRTKSTNYSCLGQWPQGQGQWFFDSLPCPIIWAQTCGQKLRLSDCRAPCERLQSLCQRKESSTDALDVWHLD